MILVIASLNWSSGAMAIRLVAQAEVLNLISTRRCGRFGLKGIGYQHFLKYELVIRVN
jgi:hypothetical protein